MTDETPCEIPEWERRYQEELRMRQDVRGRRYLLCKHMGSFTAALEQMPIGEQERQELINLAHVLLRMAVIKNDGGASPHRVPGF